MSVASDIKTDEHVCVVGRDTDAAAASPLVSIIVANFNGARYLDDCLASALRQTIGRLEVIVVDDSSTDDSVAVILEWIAQDPRVSLTKTGDRVGPGAARNLGLAAARGDWIAILDSDDMMHPRRLTGLVDLAKRLNCDIVADNQIVFDDDGVQASHPLLNPRELSANETVSPLSYIESNRLFSHGTPLGYLKPVFSRSLLEKTAYQYNPALLIAEDYDLVLRLLLQGATLHVSPEMTYFYRRHSGSISHRLSRRSLLPMLIADDLVRATTSPERPLSATLVDALDRRRASIETALRFDNLVEHLRARRWVPALSLVIRHPQVGGLLRIPIRDRALKLARPSKARSKARPAPHRITLLSRQRIVGATNGSSAYLLSICAYLKKAGFELDLVSPSPAMFGRWPVLRLNPEMEIFSSLRVRGAVRIGHVVIALDPRIALRAFAGLFGRWLRRAGVNGERLDRKAPHAVGIPLSDADRLFIADATRPSTILLIDYAFLTETIPFTLQPNVTSAVVMHDLLSSKDTAQSVLRLDRDEEVRLLGQADAVITIQADETDIVVRHLPGTKVILAPMATRAVTEAQPGRSGTVLFIGSNTGPNIDGIRWFLDEVWPDVMRFRPGSSLSIAGTCCVGIASVPEGVELLGRVDDLDALYAETGVVISPLRSGSGLKIKLVEALGHGKAVVASETTLQGVKTILADAVLQADSAAEFVQALTCLLDDMPKRQVLGTSALAVAQRHFATDACYGELLQYLHFASKPRTIRDDHAARR